jgi:hypothetical protein
MNIVVTLPSLNLNSHFRVIKVVKLYTNYKLLIEEKWTMTNALLRLFI